MSSPFDPSALLLWIRDDPVAALDAFGPRVPELAAMADCPQPANHHSEGSVWEHTRLALLMLMDLDAQIEEYAGKQLRTAGRWPLHLPRRTVTHALSVLLHDVAKPPTRRGAQGAWTYYGHDRLGARMAAQIMQRTGLLEAAAQLAIPVSAERVSWLVDNHLFWLNTKVDTVTDRAVARRYVDDKARGDDLRVLSWCDTLASRNPDGRPHVDLLVAAEVRLHETRLRHERGDEQPAMAPVLSGSTIMKELRIDPGPRVGAVLAWLSVRGLRGEAALAAVRANSSNLRSRPLAELRRT